MILPQELKRISRERRIPVDLMEKDYVLGWILYGIASSSISEKLAFKGGTALSKIYFPGGWRISEDLDFTLVDETETTVLSRALMEEVPKIVLNRGGITIGMKRIPYTNTNYLQSKFQFTGPISRNTVKVEISKETFIGKIINESVPNAFDYPRFSVKAYSLNNVAAEKLRTLIERGKIRDYYDSWKLLRTGKLDRTEVKTGFLKKCESKGIEFTNVDQFFPEGVTKELEPYLKLWLVRLSSEPLPTLHVMIDELRKMMEDFLA